MLRKARDPKSVCLHKSLPAPGFMGLRPKPHSGMGDPDLTHLLQAVNTCFILSQAFLLKAKKTSRFEDALQRGLSEATEQRGPPCGLGLLRGVSRLCGLKKR